MMTTSETSARLRSEIRNYVDDRPAAGVFRVHKDVYVKPELLELEFRHIFQRTWIFLALEAQLREPYDFVTTHVGRVPVLVTRDADHRVCAFVNVCRHKGATVCRAEQGNSRTHVCPYHGWIYDSAGRNIHIRDREQGQYPVGFDAESHDLVPLARVDSYKGLIFGSLVPDVPSLATFLGDMAFFIDMAMDQGPLGMEPIPGRATYSFRGNWKLQLDNGLDAYHLGTTHQSYINIQGRRRSGKGNRNVQSFDWSKKTAITTCIFNFPYGHVVYTAEQREPEKRPIYGSLSEIRARVGALRAHWMLRPFNALIFPNLQIANNVALILRQFRPMAADLTEMRTFCLGAVGESKEERAWRLRQFEDFYNPGGLASPDDAVVYEDCQSGLAGATAPWLQGYSRGMAALQSGPNAVAREIGIKPVESMLGPRECYGETGLHGPYREWMRLLEIGSAAAPDR
jgi:phenylpropionate dioxygenase-like ring-hydroxylating dioxygenase large terminal subunit